jgi:hypothetical protein
MSSDNRHTKNCKNSRCKNGFNNSCIFYCLTQIETHPNTSETLRMLQDNNKHIKMKLHVSEVTRERLYVQHELLEDKIRQLELVNQKLELTNCKLKNTCKHTPKQTSNRKQPNSELCCSICDVKCNSSKQFEQHMQSEKHISFQHVSMTKDSTMAMTKSSPMTMTKSSPMTMTKLPMMLEDM